MSVSTLNIAANIQKKIQYRNTVHVLVCQEKKTFKENKPNKYNYNDAEE